MSKGVFIEGITVDMLRNASLEAVEDLLVNGDMVDLEVSRTEWIPVSERLPSDTGIYLITVADFRLGHIGEYTVTIAGFYAKAKKWNSAVDVFAWMPLPQPYKEDGEK